MQVFVGNIAYEASEDDIREAFESQDITVEDVRIMAHQDTGKSRGFGFVTVPDGTNVGTVIDKMHEYSIMGRNIYVEPARGVQKRQAARN